MKRSVPVLFFVLGLLCVPAAGWLYLRFGHVPVAVADPMFPMEESLARTALRNRVDRERPKSDPVEFSDATFRDGAYVYQRECSVCHGVPGTDSKIGVNTFPRTPQFFHPRPGGNRPAADAVRRASSYHWYVDNGVRLSAMPAYRKLLSDKEQWEVSNFLATREAKMTDEVKKILSQ